MSEKIKNKLQKLLSLSKDIHELSNALFSYNFADERGWLSKKEKIEMDKLQKKHKNKIYEANGIFTNLKDEYLNIWAKFLTIFFEQLILLKNQFNNKIKSPENNAAITLLPDLIKNFELLKENKETQYDEYWAIAVGNNLLRKNNVNILDFIND